MKLFLSASQWKNMNRRVIFQDYIPFSICMALSWRENCHCVRRWEQTNKNKNDIEYENRRNRGIWRRLVLSLFNKVSNDNSIIFIYFHEILNYPAPGWRELDVIAFFISFNTTFIKLLFKGSIRDFFFQGVLIRKVEPTSDAHNTLKEVFANCYFAVYNFKNSVLN